MYQDLNAFFERPAPFSAYTADALWTDPHRAGQMLAAHLDPDGDAASRRPGLIAGIVGWLDARLGFAGKAITDLGCGPGLYASAIARRGGHVTGLDFSENSLAHARAAAGTEGLDIAYLKADYLKDELPARQDVVMLIYGDLCPLSPDRRQRLYEQVRQSLKPGGSFVFDVFSAARFAKLTEHQGFARRLMGGFWAAGDYFGFEARFLYPETHLELERYLIVTPEGRHEIYNWLQHFDEATIHAELTAAGFEHIETFSTTGGGPVDAAADDFMVLARV